MASLFFITHPEVVVDPATPVARWHLSATGIARMRHFAGDPSLAQVSAIWASSEAKAIEAAGILAGRLGLGVAVHPGLGENDRSATGFLPPPEFDRVADAFFANPQDSILGWERAIDAQTRVRAALGDILTTHRDGDIAIAGHGAIGTLLYCALAGVAIDRAYDQPFQGHFWRADLADLRPVHGWRAIAPRER